MSDIVQRAEQALEGITPGPWWWTEELRQRLIAGGGPDDLADAREIIRCAALLHPQPADAELIAAAPELVWGLVAEVKRLRSERDAALNQVADIANILGVDMADVEDHVEELLGGGQ